MGRGSLQAQADRAQTVDEFLMSAFDKIIEDVLADEGTYSNHPDDPGSETMFGITRNVARAHGYAGDMKYLTRERAIEIYRVSYWARIRGDDLHPRIAAQVMDAAVNHGVGNAIRLLQRTVNVAEDGRLGPVTLDAVRRELPLTVCVRFNAHRLRFYAQLQKFDDFGRGWIRRVAGNLLEATA